MTIKTENRESSRTNGGVGDAYRRLIEIGIALSAELNHDRLMELILLEAKDLTNADGGTIYLKTDQDTLRFQIIRNDSLKIAMGGTTGKPISFHDLDLFNVDTGAPNHHNVATHVALSGETVNVPDAYSSNEFDFSGTKEFDKGTGYRSKSFLTVPLKDHQGDVIGVLQLLNATDIHGEVVPFSADIQPLIEALASQAAVSLNKQQLIDAQRKLLDSFIELIAGAIDAKSAYTGGHCQRVPELTKMLTRAACESQDHRFHDFDLTDEEWYELHIACWLHDCGKVTTPEHIVDKATKLETIHNRIHEIRMRFEVLKRDAEIAYLQGRLDGGDEAALREQRDARLKQLDDDFAFIAECNVGGEFISEESLERIKKIAAEEWVRTLDDRLGISIDEEQRLKGVPPTPVPATEKLLADKAEHIMPRNDKGIMAADNPWGFRMDVPEHDTNLGEIHNLSIARGTLTAEDRYKINDHIVQTIIMLEALPFPKSLARVPEIAGGHHEKMDGTGYPKRLTRDEMSLPARVMAIADIFEALTAADRPYKKPKSLSQSLDIMRRMRDDSHIDPDLFDLFLESGTYREYAEKFLDPSQIDTVDIAEYVNTKR